MGITGLLPFLENSSRSVNITSFRGSTLAVDSYCLLHKGAFGCSEKLARGEDTDAYVFYCLKYIRMLQNAGIRPIMVFDGQHLPAKLETEKKRREQRNLAKKRAAELLRLDKANEARNYLRQCVDVTHDMALALIKECRKLGVDCIVAPYEADAQLAYLNLEKIVDAVVTEDSDLVLFGCSKIIFKLDLLGNGTLVETDKLYLSMQMSPDTYNFDKFRYMCILSGCDYIPSLPGIGLKKALKFIKLTANPDIYSTIQKIPAYLNMRQVVVTDEYREEFMVALATFKHQVVYDPLKRKLTRLTDPESCGTKPEHCRNAGEFFDEQVAFQLALGNLDPFTLKKVDEWDPDNVALRIGSIWSRDFKRIVPKPVESVKSKVKVRSTKHLDVTVNVKALSLVEDEKDYFKEELQTYSSAKMEKVEEVTGKVDSEEEKKIVKTLLNERKSFNPFIKNKKSSSTVIDSNRIVRSRFFMKMHAQENSIQNGEESQDCKRIKIEETSETSENNSVIVELESQCKKDKVYKPEQVSLTNNESTKIDKDFQPCKISVDVEEISTEQYTCSHKNISYEDSGDETKRSPTFSNFHTSDVFKQFHFEKNNCKMTVAHKKDEEKHKVSTDEGKTNSYLNNSLEESSDKRKRVTMDHDNDDDDGNDSNTENLTPPVQVQSTTHRQSAPRFSPGPCRSLGLQKRSIKKPVAKNQPTLLSMFAAIRK